MASVFARAQRVSLSLQSRQVSSYVFQRRRLSLTPIINTPSASPAIQNAGDATTSSPAPVKVNRRLAPAPRKLTKDERLDRFHKLHDFVAEYTKRRPAVKGPQLRDNVFMRLFELANSKEDLERVTELFPRWRDRGRVFRPRDVEAFVRRCEELDCPSLALGVFGDHSKYGVQLNSLHAGRQLLHSLHSDYPIQDTITAAALYNVYSLPPVSNDLLSAALLVRACMKNSKNENALYVAKTMLPSLKTLVEGARSDPASLVAALVTRRSGEKPVVWLQRSLQRIATGLKQVDGKANVEWLRFKTPAKSVVSAALSV